MFSRSWLICKRVFHPIPRNRSSCKKFFITILIYTLDLFLPFSVIFLMKCVLYGVVNSTTRDIYFQWSCNCYIFFVSCILLHTYLYTLILESKETFRYRCFLYMIRISLTYFMSVEHLHSLGLGRIKGHLLAKEKV